ncbi:MULTISPECIES: TonB-dependent receptor plug domain-containing protein [unclassified Tolypothrix]|uniref:TonB-dependent receptor plug domain-containing protein n=1 Tax=unclassified Tolypothrix TaxID=2649714 RepID=UPI0005EAC327|nr:MULTISPECIES: TonB-dependent receptor [unclassified Tolypothrix]BAY92158.1 TonB-dependent receptor [Microchaete diplosiphon NIES-3275]EKF04612.1 TonB-dependent receptor plug domain protein [Tolypothrix sp. PCC 7601]MBE9087088.1 TonB-dependent receptor [Tolypothrix sp. LEGE 11397]UYD26133.1 TonB-dependent receptor [Tolypothrix sp. PCC 7712]UYD31627.1 TonB-dependent receptor [Tolypothrix sp. PCC 7601]
MNKCLLLLPVIVQTVLLDAAGFASEAEIKQENAEKLPAVITQIIDISEIELPSTNAELLTQAPATGAENSEPQPADNPTTNTNSNDEADINIEVIGAEDTLPQSTPTYVIEQAEIKKQGANSLADVLKRMPGFAINDAGHGADIHTGTYYRGASINQSVFLINGRAINTNINTYHGGTDLNSIPVEAIERVELYSGAASALYGSSAFGGVVNIITKEGYSQPKLTSSVEFGSLSQNNQQFTYAGSTGAVKYNFSFERYFTDNRYRVPVGAANRDSQGFFFNADTATSTYFGSIGVDLNQRNSLNLDISRLSSRRGLTYFGFPLQRDRLDHDGFNAGLSWKTRLGNGENSILTTTFGYNQDYFSTYGPTVFQGREFYRTGVLDTQQFTARLDHQWRMTPNNQLRWGLDLKNTDLTGDVLSSSPNRIGTNETEDRSVFTTALFAVNTFNISDNFLIDLGLRQNFDSQFGDYLNPSVGLRYAVAPSIAVRGSWTGGQRNPGLDQLYVYDTVHGWEPNPDLKPETGSSWTAGVDINFSENLTGQFTYFGSSLDNRLGVIAGKWQNIGLVDTNGLEAALQLKFARGWSTFVNYTYTDAQIKTGDERGLQLGLIPYSVLQTGIGYQNSGWQANLYVTYNSGARRSLFNRTGDRPTDFAPSFLNLDLSGRIPLTRSLGLIVYLENLLGEQYERVNRIYSPGFTFRLGLSSEL